MRPEPLRFWYVGLIPLREAVLEGERIGGGRVAGRDCDIFLFSAVPSGNASQDLVYCLDAATSMPLKVQAFSKQARYQGSKPSWAWEAITLDDVQGYHVSLSSRYTAYIVNDDTASTVQLTEDYKIESITFNKKHPGITFWPKLEQGVYVNDLITRKDYYNTPDKKAPRDNTSTAVTAVVDSIVAGEPSDLTPWMSAAGILFGGALLVLGACLWVKRR